MSASQPSLNQIYFYLTEGCNCACRHCWIQPKFQSGNAVYPSLDIELFKSIIMEAKPLGLSGVKLTGGEPLLHPHIIKILEHIKDSDLGLTIETNGLLCNPEIAQQIALCKNRFVSVSLDGVDAQTHEWVRGVPGCFEKTLIGIRNLVAAGIRPQVIMTIMRCNRAQMEQMVRLAEGLGCGSVKFNIVQPTARGEKMHEAQDTLSIEELVETGRWVENELSSSSKIPIVYSHPAAFKPLSKLLGNKGDGCGICSIFGILGVLSNGSYALCGIGETVPEFIFGNALSDRLVDVWHNTPMLNEIREGLPGRLKGVCGDCLVKTRCLGSCIAQNYYRSRDLWADFWYCEEAHKKGLYPVSRLNREQQCPG